MKTALLAVLLLLQCGLFLCSNKDFSDTIFYANSLRQNIAESKQIANMPALMYSPELESFAEHMAIYCTNLSDIKMGSKHKFFSVTYKDYNGDHDMTKKVAAKFLTNPSQSVLGGYEHRHCDKFNQLMVLESSSKSFQPITGAPGTKCEAGVTVFKGLCYYK